jgi:hypothetical protein
LVMALPARGAAFGLGGVVRVARLSSSPISVALRALAKHGLAERLPLTKQ